jgi:RHS repeat-associated protein
MYKLSVFLLHVLFGLCVFAQPLAAQGVLEDLYLNSYEQPAKASRSIRIYNGLSVPAGKSFEGEIIPFASLPEEASGLTASANTSFYVGEKTTLSASAEPRRGSALSLDGINAFVSISSTPYASLTNNFTMEAWVYPQATHDQADAESITGTAGVSGPQRYVVFPAIGETWGTGHAGAGFSVGTNGVNVYEHAGGYLPAVLVWKGTISGWTHIAIVYSNGLPKLYINGEWKKDGLKSNKIIHPSANVGGSSYGYFQGMVEELRVWNKARTVQEINQDRNKTIDPATVIGLSAYYRFDEILDKALVTDLSMKALGETPLHGTLFNNASRVPSTLEMFYQPRTLTWKDAQGNVLAQGNSLEISPSAASTYTYRVSCPDGKGGEEVKEVVVTVLPKDALVSTTPDPASNNYNYITTNTILVKGKKELIDITSLSLPELHQQTTYFDGLGRPMQQVTTRGSAEKYDIVQAIEYDAFGREENKYLPYTGGVTGFYQGNALKGPIPTGNNNYYLSSDQYNFYNNGSSTNRVSDTKPYAKAVFEPSPLNRILEQGAPGNHYQPLDETGHSLGNTLKVKQRTNTEREIRRWEYFFDNENTVGVIDPYAKSNVTDAYLGHYAFNNGEGELFVTETEDENRHIVIEYKDKEGRIVAKKVQDSKNGEPLSFAETHYIYDSFGYLRFVIPPMGVAELASTGNYLISYSDDFVKRWCFAYLYDERGRMIEKRVPGADPVYMVYNSRDELILTQDGRQRVGYKQPDGTTLQAAGEWSFTKYDAFGRVVMTGLFKGGAGLSREDMQQAVKVYEGVLTPATSDDHELFEQISVVAGNLEGYTNSAFPADVSKLEVLSVNYYDGYDFLPDNEDDFDYHRPIDSNNNPLTAFNALESDKTKGKATGGKVKVLYKTPVQWLYSVSYYDKWGRVIGGVADNHTGGKDFVNTRYDFAGKALETVTRHENPEDATRAKIVVRERPVYDHAGRVLEMHQRVNEETEERLSKITYNELGETDKKMLGRADLQEVDYHYNIRGWMTKINDIEATLANTAQPVASQKLFALQLNYSRGDEDDTDRQQDGNITSMHWKSATDNVKRGYVYDYDALNRLTKAQYSKVTTGATMPVDAAETYSLGGASADGGMEYDKNGNILSMNRYGYLSKGNYGLIDQLSYSYLDYTYSVNGKLGNRLQAVSDGGAAQSMMDDFKDVSTASNQEYIYDESGNLEEDKNKGISYIYYNHLNLPSRINFASGNYLLYTYDASGRKLKTEVYTGNAITKVTNYLGKFYYEDKVEGSQMQYIRTAEGRALAPGLTASARFAYEYSYKDHLGNLRMSFREGAKDSYLATMESLRTLEENLEFSNVSTTLANDGTSSSGSNSSRLNSAKVLGPWKTLKVSRGDKITAKAYGLYKNDVADQTKNNPLHIYAATAPNSGGQENEKTISLLRIGVGFNLASAPSQQEVLVPNAYLKYIAYDEKENALETEAKLITSAAKYPGGGWQELSFSFTAKEDGYLQVMVANESEQPVYFDDIEIVQEKGLIVQENHYDPYGLNLAGIEKQGQPDDMFQYNGKEKQEEFGLNWNDYGARYYDPQLGRWHAVDPATDLMRRHSPYNYAFDNPIRFTDPDGMMPNNCCGGNILSLVENEYYAIENEIKSLPSKVGDGINSTGKAVGEFLDGIFSKGNEAGNQEINGEIPVGSPMTMDGNTAPDNSGLRASEKSEAPIDLTPFSTISGPQTAGLPNLKIPLRPEALFKNVVEKMEKVGEGANHTANSADAGAKIIENISNSSPSSSGEQATSNTTGRVITVKVVQSGDSLVETSRSIGLPGSTGTNKDKIDTLRVR